jgi:hypothetical protein
MSRSPRHSRPLILPHRADPRADRAVQGARSHGTGRGARRSTSWILEEVGRISSAFARWARAGLSLDVTLTRPVGGQRPPPAAPPRARI